MGGGGGSIFTPRVPPPTENYPAKKMGIIGETTWDDTIPLRSSLLDIYTKFLNPANNYNVSNLPGYAANYNLARGGVEDSYNSARQNIISTMPRGGALYGGLNALEMDRAKNLGNVGAQLTSTFTNDLMNKAYNTGYVAAPTIALQGLGAHATDTRTSMNAQLAAEMQAQQMVAQQKAAQNQGKSGGMGLLGTGIGSLLGMAAAPMTGGASLFGSGMSALGSMGSGKGGISNQAGYSQLMGQAQPLSW